MAGNALAVLRGNLRVAHGAEIAAEVSGFALVDEVAEVYPGMMIAVPPTAWPRSAALGAAEVAGLRNELAAGVPVHRMF
ncbi:MAG: IS4/IS5 family transposase, partial [Catenulispora sp.]